MGKAFSLDSPAMQFFSQAFDLFVLNLITILCCLPIVTAGASLTAMHYVLYHKVIGDDRGAVKPFFKSFRENLRQATVIWLLILAGAALIAADIRIRDLHPQTILAQRVDLLILLPAAVLIMVFLYVFPILSRFANTIPRTVANALTAAIVFFPRTIAMALIQGAWLWILWNFPLRLTPFLILLGFVFPWYLCSKIYKKVLLRMEGAQLSEKEIEENEIEIEEIEMGLEEA